MSFFVSVWVPLELWPISKVLGTSSIIPPLQGILAISDGGAWISKCGGKGADDDYDGAGGKGDNTNLVVMDVCLNTSRFLQNGNDGDGENPNGWHW